MNRYVLLGTYETDARMNIEVIAADDKIEWLKRIQSAIDKVNTYLSGKDRDEPCPKTLAAIERYLSEIDIIDNSTGFVHEINSIGIFELREIETDEQVTKKCAWCGKVLFEGTEKEAKGLIIYCTDCANDKG